MSTVDLNILADAIARNSAAVLSLPSAGMLRHHKSRFLAEDDATGDAFWIESAPDERALIDAMILGGQAAGLSFKSGTKKVVFASQLLRREPNYAVNADTIVEALLVARPKAVKAIQRRSNYRVRVPGDCDLRVRVWRIGQHVYLGDRPPAAQELIVRVRDMSTGGVGVTFLPRDGEPPRVTSEDRLRVAVDYHDISTLIEGRMRHPSLISSATPTPAGIQFKALQNNLAGRQTLAQLTKILGELQRAEVRRMRLGVIADA